MVADPWVKFYPSDWLAGTSGLTAAERGVYITIVCLIYETGGPVRLDLTRLARRCGVPAGSFRRILDSLMDQGKLVQTPDGITNKRAEDVMQDRENRITKAQSGALKTNAIQAEKRQQKQAPQQKERDAERYANQNQNQIKKRETKVSLCARDGFAAFWAVVPRRVGKGAAEKAWQAATAKAQPEAIIDAMRLYAKSREGQDEKYTCHPATWLNQRRWEDDAPKTPDDFHAKLQRELSNADAIRGPDAIGDGADQRRLALLGPAEQTGRREAADDPGNLRGSEQAYIRFLQPRRVPGAH